MTKKKTPTRAGNKFKGGIFTAILQMVRKEKSAIRMIYLFAVVLGAFFPMCAYISKSCATISWQGTPCLLLTAACLAFSLPTALQIGKVAFSGIKGKGFAFALEMAMLFAPNKPVQVSALIILITCNVLAVFYNLQSGKEFSTLVESN